MTKLGEAVRAVLERRPWTTARQVASHLRNQGVEQATKAAVNGHLYGSPNVYVHRTDQKGRPLWALRDEQIADRATPGDDLLLRRLLLAEVNELDAVWNDIAEAYDGKPLPDEWAAEVVRVLVVREHDGLRLSADPKGALLVDALGLMNPRPVDAAMSKFFDLDSGVVHDCVQEGDDRELWNYIECILPGYRHVPALVSAVERSVRQALRSEREAAERFRG